MRRSRIAVLSCVLAGFSLCSWTVFSDDSPKSKPPAGSRDRADADSSGGVVLRAHAVVGLAVKSPEGKDLGKVEDLVIDTETGSVRYAAIAFGGFLGFGDKLFAVPFKSLHVRYDSKARANHFEMYVDKNVLEKAKGFDKNHWPNFSDPRFSEENDRHFVSVDVKR